MLDWLDNDAGVVDIEKLLTDSLAQDGNLPAFEVIHRTRETDRTNFP